MTDHTLVTTKSVPTKTPPTKTPPSSRRPVFLRRGPMEALAVAVIALGFLMLFQPVALVLYTYSFITLLAGTLMFTIVSKFPE